MHRNLQDRSLVTIDNILRVARTLFINKQYADVSLKEIALEAGVTKGALYHHFASKEELYMSMIFSSLEVLRTLTVESKKTTQGLPCKERLQHSLAKFLQLPDDIIGMIQLVRRDSNIFESEVRKRLVSVYQDSLPNPLQDILSEAIKNGEIIESDPRLLTWQYVAIVEVSLHPYARSLFDSSDELASVIVSNFINGICTEEKTIEALTRS